MELLRAGCWAHVLVCTNAREPSANMPSCRGPGRRAEADGEAVWASLRGWVAQHNLLAKVWVTKTGCLGWCDPHGVTVMVYPDGARYRAVTTHDCEAIVRAHLAPLLARR